MKTRLETIITICKEYGGAETKEIILPEGVTDYIVFDYDGYESLFFVINGKLYNEDMERVDHEGIKIEESDIMKVSPF